jgi:type I restriction enzyme S subunit
VIINQQIQAYIPRGNVSPMFFRYCVQISKTYFEMQGNSTTLAYVDREAFSNMPLLLPSISDQNAIVEILNVKLDRLEQAVTQLQREISLLREYRTRLIADVVTGKLDVREVVNLPEETDETESFDDSLPEDDDLENSEIENDQAGELEEEILA